MTPDPAATLPRLSVICVFYNAAEYIAEAIDSVIAQDFQDFELLLVDDGSTDGSKVAALEALRTWDGEFRCLAHRDDQNRGISASRNLGLAAAAGELVAFIDADDRWVPTKLREQVDLLARFPDIDAVCGTVRYWRSWSGGADKMVPTGHDQNRVILPPEALLRLYPLGRAAAPCPSDIMLRRSIAMALGGFEESFPGMYEDQAFLAKVYLEGLTYFADRHWLDYRLHDRSCMATAIREGGYHEARERFLRWFASYLASKPSRAPLAVRIALQRALLRYRLGWLIKPLRGMRRAIRLHHGVPTATTS